MRTNRGNAWMQAQACSLWATAWARYPATSSCGALLFTTVPPSSCTGSIPETHPAKSCCATPCCKQYSGLSKQQAPSHRRRYVGSSWLAVLIVSWGIISALGCLVNSADGYLVQRLVLGLVEAGTFPGQRTAVPLQLMERCSIAAAKGQFLSLSLTEIRHLPCMSSPRAAQARMCCPSGESTLFFVALPWVNVTADVALYWKPLIASRKHRQTESLLCQ